MRHRLPRVRRDGRHPAQPSLSPAGPAFVGLNRGWPEVPRVVRLRAGRFRRGPGALASFRSPVSRGRCGARPAGRAARSSSARRARRASRAPAFICRRSTDATSRSASSGTVSRSPFSRGRAWSPTGPSSAKATTRTLAEDRVRPLRHVLDLDARHGATLAPECNRRCLTVNFVIRDVLTPSWGYRDPLFAHVAQSHSLPTLRMRVAALGGLAAVSEREHTGDAGLQRWV
jgi:hypothetical protein